MHYLRTDVSGGWFHGFNKDFIFSFTASAGYIDGWNGDSIRITDRFYKGRRRVPRLPDRRHRSA